MMTAQPFENILVPDPVLEHLTGQLAKVSLNFCSAEPRVIGIRAHVVHDVAELVEEGGHIHESEKPILIIVSLHVSHGFLLIFTYVVSRHNLDDLRAALLIFTSKQVQIKLAKKLVGLRIVNAVAGNLLGPD